MTWEQQHVPSILNVWFGGSESADAICDVLFGDVCPSGKLTATFPQNVGQLPMNYNHKIQVVLLQKEDGLRSSVAIILMSRMILYILLDMD